MRWVLLRVGLGIILPGFVFAEVANGQEMPSQSIVSSPSPAISLPDSRSNENDHESAAIQPLADISETSVDPASLLPDLPALPSAKASLIGGTVEKLDRVKDRLTVQVFGGGRMTISFDPRTQLYKGSARASASDLHPGDRVYVDTILVGSTVFARSIRLKNSAIGENQGIVLRYQSDRGELEIRDALSPNPLQIRLTPQTRVTRDGHPVSAGDLAPGTLVAVKFGAQQNGSDVAREVSVLAVPGTSFTFTGRVTTLDLRLGLLVINSSTDGKTYEVYFDPSVLGIDNSLRTAAGVTVLARFDGNRYVARSVTVNSQNP